MTLSPEDGSGEIASINQVGSELVPELGFSLLDPLKTGQLVINIRAEADPEEMNNLYSQEVAAGISEDLKGQLKALVEQYGDDTAPGL